MFFLYEGHVEFMFLGSKTITYRMKGAVKIFVRSRLFIKIVQLLIRFYIAGCVVVFHKIALESLYIILG